MTTGADKIVRIVHHSTEDDNSKSFLKNILNELRKLRKRRIILRYSAKNEETLGMIESSKKEEDVLKKMFKIRNKKRREERSKKP